MRIRLRPSDDASSWVIEDASLGFGGVAATTIVTKRASQSLIGRKFCEQTIHESTNVLLQEVRLPESVPGGKPQYRAALTASFLLRSFLKICLELQRVVELSASEVRISRPLALPHQCDRCMH
jgi:xanthine dehydrogenase/oxidase